MVRISPAAQAQRRATLDAAQIVQAREEALQMMNKELRKKFNIIQRQLDEGRQTTLRFYYDLGKLCTEVQDDPDKYGESAMRLLEQALAIHARQLRKAASFTQAYTKEALQELLELHCDKTGFQLHWGHVSYLLILKTPDKRRMWAKRAVRGLWAPPELHRRIKEHYGPAVTSPHGPTFKLPPTVPSKIRQIRDDTEKWLAKQRQAWNGTEINAFHDIMSAPPETWTPEMIEDLRVARAAMEGMRDEATENMRRLDELITHASSCYEATLQRREAEAAATGAGRRHTRSIRMPSADPV
jgi:hypothetical protein